MSCSASWDMSSEEWKRHPLGELVVPDKGLITGPFGSQLHASDYVSTGIPVIMPKDLVDGSVRRPAAQVSVDKARDLQRFRLQPGDVVVARRGTLGRCALVDGEHAGWLCGTGCLRLRFRPSVDPRYFVYFFRWPRTVAWLTSHAVGQTMANLNRKTLATMPVTVPPLEEQQRLAEAFEAMDLHRADLLAYRAAEAALQRGVLNQLLESPAGASWPEHSLGELATFTNGHRFKASDWSDVGLPIVRIQNLSGNPHFKRFAGYAKPSWTVRQGDLLFAWSGTRTSLGPTLWPGPQGVLNQHIFHVRPKGGVHPRWLYEVLRQVTAHLAPRAQGFKSTLLHLRKGHLTRHRVAVPPRHEQQRIAQHSQLLSERLLLFADRLTSLTELQNSLMDDLLSGRRRVPAATLPQSASQQVEDKKVQPSTDGPQSRRQDQSGSLS